MSIETKSRRNYSIKMEGVEKITYNGNPIYNNRIPCEHSEFQTTISGTHPRPRGISDNGGGFLSRKTGVYGGYAMVDSQTRRNDPYNGINRIYQGPIFAAGRTSNLGTGDFVEGSSQARLNAMGTNAIASCIPTNPLSGLGVFLGELRDAKQMFEPLIGDWKRKGAEFRRLDHIIKDKRDINPKAYSDAYLAFQFGWAPYVRDILSFAKVAKNLDKYIQQYSRGSGQNIRRRRTLPSESATATVNMGVAYGSPVLDTPHYSRPGYLLRTDRKTANRWFSGCFTYYLPSAVGFGNRARRTEALANRLLGTRLTPDLVWKLAPWSWAADWVGNAGNVIHNWSAFSNDGLIMRYGYVMETTVSETVYSLRDCVLYEGRRLDLDQTVRSVTKSRSRATPYGFGLNESDFSSKQKAIILALGISRGL